MKRVSYIDGNLFSPKDAWDALSMAEKSEMMKVAVQNGITNLDDIRREYNEFAGGGYISKAKALIKDNEGWRAKPYDDAPKGKTWRSVGYGFNDSGFFDKYPEGISRHYENGITEAQAEQELNYILNKADKHLRSIYGKQWDSFNDNQKAAIMDTYYQRPASVGRKSAFYNAVKSGKDGSKYLGVKGFDDRNRKRQSVFGGGAVPVVAKVKEVSLPQEIALQPIVENIPEFIPLNPQAFNTTLPTYQRPELTFEEPVVQETPVSPYSPEEIERQERAEGLANLGRFLSFTNTSGNNNTFLNTIGMLTGNTFADGGGIHIKPSHRGRLTELKKRTGKSEAELYKTGGPAVRKMITFARNARKWKHEDGGHIYGDGGGSFWNTAKQYAKDIKEQVLTPIIEEPQKFISRAIMGYAQQSLPGLANPFKDSRIWDSMVSDHGTAQDTYLMSRRLQDKIFKEKGYIPGKEGDYGLVKKAVGNKKLPIYQTAPDAISRDKLIFLGNDGYYWADHGLENPGSYPHASYTDGHGNFYQKAWDLNDYGEKGGATTGILGNIVDFIGNPVVVTTGFQKMDINDPWAIEALASDMAKKGLVPTKINGKIEWTLPEVVVKGKRKKKSYGGNLFDDGGSYSYTKPLDNVIVDEYGNLLDPNVPSARGTIQIPEVIATTRDPRKAVPTANYLNSIDSPTTQIRNTLYRRILPISDYDIRSTLSGMMDGEFEYNIRNDHKFDYEEGYPENTDYTTIGGTKAPLSVIDGIWAEYLQIPQKDRKKFVGPTIQQSKYKPSSGGRSDTNYYALPLTEGAKSLLVNEGMGLPIGKNKVTETLEKYGNTVFNLGDHTIGRGKDNKGDYISYYDVFDLNPFSDKYNGTNIPLLNKLGDASFGIGRPVHIYDRIYLDDYYGMPKEYRGSSYLPEVKVLRDKPYRIEKTYRKQE